MRRFWTRGGPVPALGVGVVVLGALGWFGVSGPARAEGPPAERAGESTPAPPDPGETLTSSEAFAAFNHELEQLQKLLLAGRYRSVENGARNLLERVDHSRYRYPRITAAVLDLLVTAMLRTQSDEAPAEYPRSESLRYLAERALRVKRQAVGGQHPGLADSLVNLATALMKEGKHNEARDFFERALAIREAALGPEHALVGESRYYLALLLLRQGQDAAARPYLERALAILEAATGPDDPNVWKCQRKLAQVRWRAGEHAAALELLGSELAARQRAGGGAREAAERAGLTRYLGALRIALGDTEGAAAAGVDSVDALISLQAQAADDDGTGAAWGEPYAAGQEALRQQDWAGAITHLGLALAARAASARGTPGVAEAVDYHPYLALGIAHYNLGDYATALSMFEVEERQGAIGENAGARNNLDAFRRLARKSLPGRAGAPPDDEARVAGIVERALAEADEHERAGRLDEALEALGRVVAVDPGHAGAAAGVERLRGLLAEREREREVARRVEQHLERGRAHLAAGEYGQASAVLSRALSLRPSDEARTLLERAQAKLSDELRAARDAEQRLALVNEGLAEAAALEAAGEFDQALGHLQEVLALAPGNAAARAAQAGLLARREAAERERADRETAARLTDEGERLLAAGTFDQAVARFSRLLDLQPGNVAARASLRQALDGLARAVLREPLAGPTVPPVVVLANVAAPRPDGGAPEEVVSRAEVVLSGIIDDDRPSLTLEIREAGRAGAGAGDDAGRVLHAATLTSDQRRGTLYRYRFRQALPLRAGAAELRVRVSDDDGLVGEAVHRVRYARPLQRSPWFWSGVALVAGGVGAAVPAARARRRRRLLRRRFNPYAAGAPIFDDKLFIGREALLERVLQTIHNNSILLYGERRIGKTSLQHHLHRRLRALRDPEYEFFPVYVDLEGTPQEKFFETLARETFEQLADELDGARPGAGTGAGDSMPEGYDYHAFVGDVRRVLRALRKRSDRKIKLALLIDEVDELNAYDPKVNQRLRSLFMKSFAHELVAVVSGVGIKKHWEGEGSPWFNFFEEIAVEPFTPQHARELIERPIRGVFELEDGVVDAIVERAALRPYRIQKLCIALVNRLHERGARRITRADVDAVGTPAEG